MIHAFGFVSQLKSKKQQEQANLKYEKSNENDHNYYG